MAPMTAQTACASGAISTQFFSAPHSSDWRDDFHWPDSGLKRPEDSHPWAERVRFGSSPRCGSRSRGWASNGSTSDTEVLFGTMRPRQWTDGCNWFRRMSSRLRRCAVLIAIASGLGLTGCYGRAKSNEPGSIPPGEGAGQRGGQNSGDTRVNGNPPNSANSQGPADPVSRNTPEPSSKK
jgi:hypothetical protein